jgi:membrane-associated phospholipid phosphatase
MMSQNPKRISKLIPSVSGIINSVIPIFRSWYFYLGLLSLIAGIELNFVSQTYLNNYINEGKSLPMLSDLILDNLSLYDVSFLYDLFSFISVIVVLIYIVHKKEYKSIPFFLLMCGILEIVRGIFIILTPLGNPPMFIGSNTLFNGFSKYELGVYPSGHVGSAFLFFLMVKNRWYKCIILFCLIIIIISLLLAHAHYSIDILSGFFFAYAIYSFGTKHLKMFKLDWKHQFPVTDIDTGIR